MFLLSYGHCENALDLNPWVKFVDIYVDNSKIAFSLLQHNNIRMKHMLHLCDQIKFIFMI